MRCDFIDIILYKYMKCHIYNRHEIRKNIENAICIDVCMKYEYDMNIGLYDKI